MTALVARRPITAFFTLAIALSWLAWLPYVLSDNGLGIVHFGFPPVLGTTQILGMLPGAYLGPIFSAFIVTALAEGRPGLRAWAGRLLRWRVNWRWYALALFAVPVVLTLASLPFAGALRAPATSLILVWVLGFVLQVLTTGLAEEPGWRDFALPHLQPKYGPLRGTLILGPLWGVWHLPLFFTEWGHWPNVTVWSVLEFVGTAIAISFVMTWVFNRSGESLPIALLLHAGINNYLSVAWSELFPNADPKIAEHLLFAAFAAAALVVLAATKGRLGYLSPARELQAVQ
ncbi:CPBP family intramembrane glutamic endopeptidase [Amycolatopsis sp. Poz14]|uniref:CPBP family intramembrane glutamic endopeptidase n=1 Tax=Amycolatopsis sp. Poz14 TaxID=1447705 RepID=UPI001EE99267|nr:type II CAAX endopeptidase family protein [Amycolatopsis sp. Poz14]MCG3757231.1 CPBP family intramembrane metalloprotease [Amycolatopsis sp. Poz14]